ncbi:citrate lyase, beta subunit [Enterococcus sp. AZ093]
MINPRQIPLVHAIYEPTEKEIQAAKEVIWGIQEAEAKGSGVISVNGKMVDKPIVERAERVIALAKAAKLIREEEI